MASSLPTELAPPSPLEPSENPSECAGRGEVDCPTAPPSTSVQDLDPGRDGFVLDKDNVALLASVAQVPSIGNCDFQRLRAKNSENVRAQGFFFCKTLIFS